MTTANPIGKVTFEHVNAITHPEYYQGDMPAVQASGVPDEHWSYVERVGDDVRQQYEGLLTLERRGELIRNPRLYEAEAPAEPVWREIKPGGGADA